MRRATLSSRALVFGPLLTGLLLTGVAFAVDSDLKKQVKDPDSFKRSDAARALGKDGSPEAAKLLVQLIHDRNPYVRDYTVEAAGNLRDDDAVKILARAAKDKDELVRRNVAEALGGTRSIVATPTLGTLATKDRSALVRAAALDALWGFRDESELGAEFCVQALGDSDPFVRAAAVEAIGRMRAENAAEVTRGALEDIDEGVRCVARMQLRFVDPEAAAADLVTAANDDGWRTRMQAVESAYWMRDVAAMAVLVERVGDERVRVAAAAHQSLVDLSGKELGRDIDLWRAWWEQNQDSWEAPSKGRGTEPPEEKGGTRARYHGLEVLGDVVVFVLDASGSMKDELEGTATGKTGWQTAHAELTKTIDALPDGVHVNVITFQAEPRVAFNAPKPLAKKSRKDIASFLKRVSPGQPGNLLDAMLLALDQDDVDAIYLLSDGAPSAGDMVVKGRVRTRIRAVNRSRKVALNAIGFGAKKTSERNFLNGLARDSMARAVFR